MCVRLAGSVLVRGRLPDPGENGHRCIDDEAGAMPDLAEYVTVFKALSDPLRLRLLNMLPSRDEKCTFCVCELAQKLGVSQPCLSHHLAILKATGLVGFEKDGCSVFYFVERDQIVGQLDRFREMIQGK